jgi:hypothetical protein
MAIEKLRVWGDKISNDCEFITRIVDFSMDSYKVLHSAVYLIQSNGYNNPSSC